MDKSTEIGEVSLVFNVKIFGKCKINEIDRRIEDARMKLFEFEQEFNKENLLRMHVWEGDPL